MTNYTLSKYFQPRPNNSPEWCNCFHTYLTLGQSRTLKSALGSQSTSNSTLSSTVSKQTAKWRW